MTPKKYRISNGMELTESQHLPEKSVFVISDLHLDHKEIISCFKRPFRTVRKMNEVLINNWNYVVKPDDTVFFVGDLVFGSPDKFFSKLNGKIRIISGNHDKELDPKGLHETLLYSYKGIDFFFIHETIKRKEKMPKDFDGWIIHGHHHNNNTEWFPFFCPEKKRINVSVELVKYQPVSLDFIVSLIKEGHEKITSL